MPINDIQGPGLFLAQFLGEDPPFHNIDALAGWASDLGSTGVQVPTWDERAIDLDMAASSQTYCDEYKGQLADQGVTVLESADTRRAVSCGHRRVSLQESVSPDA